PRINIDDTDGKTEGGSTRPLIFQSDRCHPCSTVGRSCLSRRIQARRPGSDSAENGKSGCFIELPILFPPLPLFLRVSKVLALSYLCHPCSTVGRFLSLAAYWPGDHATTQPKMENQDASLNCRSYFLRFLCSSVFQRFWLFPICVIRVYQWEGSCLSRRIGPATTQRLSRKWKIRMLH